MLSMVYHQPAFSDPLACDYYGHSVRCAVCGRPVTRETWLTEACPGPTRERADAERERTLAEIQRCGRYQL
jgi:hypothetical protein